MQLGSLEKKNNFEPYSFCQGVNSLSLSNKVMHIFLMNIYTFAASICIARCLPLKNDIKYVMLIMIALFHCVVKELCL